LFFQCIVTLHGSENYKFVVVEEYGIVSSYNPRLKSGDIQTMVYVSANNLNPLYVMI